MIIITKSISKVNRKVKPFLAHNLWLLYFMAKKDLTFLCTLS